MKKGIEVYPDYDAGNRWKLVIEKKRGKLTLDEIREAAREYEYDYYLLVLDCFHDQNDEQYYYYETPLGDKVELYRTEILNEE